MYLRNTEVQTIKTRKRASQLRIFPKEIMNLSMSLEIEIMDIFCLKIVIKEIGNVGREPTLPYWSIKFYKPFLIKRGLISSDHASVFPAFIVFHEVC